MPCLVVNYYIPPHPYNYNPAMLGAKHASIIKSKLKVLSYDAINKAS